MRTLLTFSDTVSLMVRLAPGARWSRRSERTGADRAAERGEEDGDEGVPMWLLRRWDGPVHL